MQYHIKINGNSPETLAKLRLLGALGYTHAGSSNPENDIGYFTHSEVLNIDTDRKSCGDNGWSSKRGKEIESLEDLFKDPAKIVRLNGQTEAIITKGSIKVGDLFFTPEDLAKLEELAKTEKSPAPTGFKLVPKDKTHVVYLIRALYEMGLKCNRMSLKEALSYSSAFIDGIYVNLTEKGFNSDSYQTPNFKVIQHIEELFLDEAEEIKPVKLSHKYEAKKDGDFIHVGCQKFHKSVLAEVRKALDSFN